MIRFDENTSNYIQVTDDARLDLPDGDWCIGIWESTSDNTGTGYQWFISTAAYGVANSYLIYFTEASEATAPNRFSFSIRNASNQSLYGASGFFNTSTVLTFDGTKRFWVLQRNSGNMQVYMCLEGGTPTEILNAALTNTGSVSPSELEIGRRADASSAYGGDLGGLFKMNVALTTAEIEDIANGYTPMHLGYIPKHLNGFYFELASNAANPPEYYGNLTATRNGTLADGATLSIDFSTRTKMILPDGQIFMTGAATYTAQAAGGGNSINPNGVASSWNGLSSYSWNGVT